MSIRQELSRWEFCKTYQVLGETLGRSHSVYAAQSSPCRTLWSTHSSGDTALRHQWNVTNVEHFLPRRMDYFHHGGTALDYRLQRSHVRWEEHPCRHSNTVAPNRPWNWKVYEDRTWNQDWHRLCKFWRNFTYCVWKEVVDTAILNKIIQRHGAHIIFMSIVSVSRTSELISKNCTFRSYTGNINRLPITNHGELTDHYSHRYRSEADLRPFVVQAVDGGIAVWRTSNVHFEVRVIRASPIYIAWAANEASLG